MQHSKLATLLRTFTKKERAEFSELVRCSFINTSAPAARLFDWFDRHITDHGGVSRHDAFTAVFPGAPYDEALLNHTMSFLLKAAEKYVGLKQMEADRNSLDFYILQGLSDRSLDKHYQFLYEKSTRGMEQGVQQDAPLYYARYRLENLEANRFSQSNMRLFNDHVQKTADYLDAFYLTEKLRCSCYMVVSQIMLATPYNFQLVQELCQFLDRHPIPEDAPAIRVYYYIFTLFTRDHAPEVFQQLKHLLETESHRFSAVELAELYQYATNYCNLQIMKVREQYVAEALDLYSTGVDKGILLQKGILSPWHYKNMIKLALRLRRYTWTEKFIEEKTSLLESTFRADAYAYNLAELYYHTGRYDEAMTALNKVEFTDIHYNLGAKVLLAKIYFEQDAMEALDSLLHAFKAFLQRNKVISEEFRRTYLNFISLLGKIMRATPGQKPALHAKLHQTPLLTEKNWLLQQLGYS